MKYVLGLDIGITSVGWAVLDLDRHRIEDLGVRAFNAAEDPKTQAALAEPRRLARGARRCVRRRAGRRQRARELFVRFGLLSREELESAFLTGCGKADPWELRAAGLDRRLTGKEWARALFHIAKRRGFKSNRKTDRTTEDKKMLGAIESNRRMLEEGGYRTAGEMFCRDPQYTERKRNKPESYTNTVDRSMLEDEIRTLFDAQRRHGSRFASEEFEREFIEVFAWQLPFASGDDILNKVGRCTFEAGERRGPKHCYHVERFNVLQKINGLSYSCNGNTLRLTADQRARIVKMAHQFSKVTYDQIRRKLDLPVEARFTGLRYVTRNKETRQYEESLKCENSTCVEMRGYHTLRKACNDHGVWEQVRDKPDVLDDLAYALTFYKTREDITSYLAERGVKPEVVEAVVGWDRLEGVDKEEKAA